MNVLVIAPHPDDEALGCGGAIRLHANGGDRVSAVFLTSGELGLRRLAIAEARQIREREALVAMKILGIQSVYFLQRPDWFLGDCIAETAGALRGFLERESPQLIYLPHPQDNHPDHRATAEILRATAFTAPATRTYEIWSPLPSFDHVEDITAVMPAKLRAVRCYRSQLTEFAYDHAIRGLNRYRGALAGRCRYAEVFGSLAPL